MKSTMSYFIKLTLRVLIIMQQTTFLFLLYIYIYIFFFFSRANNTWNFIRSQTIHIECQALFSLKRKLKRFSFRLLKFCLALWVIAYESGEGFGANSNSKVHGQSANQKICTVLLSALRKHAYSNILKILPKKWKISDKKFWYFSCFCSKHRLWVLVRTASLRRF